MIMHVRAVLLLPLVALLGAGCASEAPDQAAAESPGVAAASRTFNPTPFDQHIARMREQGLVPIRHETFSESFRGSQRDNEEYQKIPPIKVFDNLYYVGPGFVSAWLLQTSDGLILFDGAQEPYVDHIISNIRAAGFNVEDIEYVLISHGHLDHFGGVARIAKLAGARVGALEGDWASIEEIAKRPPNPNRPMPDVPTRDLVLEEGMDLTLGNTTIKVYHLPGHTAGSPSFEFTVYDNGTPHKALLIGGPSQRGGVEGAEQFVSTVARLKKELSDVEVPVHVHSWQTTYPLANGGIFERAQRFAYRQPGDPHPFVDNVDWRIWLDAAEAGAAKYLADQRAAGGEQGSVD